MHGDESLLPVDIGDEVIIGRDEQPVTLKTAHLEERIDGAQVNDQLVRILENQVGVCLTGAALIINGLAFILVSIFKPDAGNIILIIGLLSVALGSILNMIRIRQSKRNGVK